MPSFETGVRLLKNILIKKRSYSAFYADEADALHKAFPAKATVHAGPFGIPMLWNSARNFLWFFMDRDTKRIRKQPFAAPGSVVYLTFRFIF